MDEAKAFEFADFTARHKTRQRSRLLGIIGVTVGLLSVTLASGYYRLSEREAFLRQTVATISQQAKAIQVIENKITLANKDLAFYLQKRNQIDSTNILPRLSQLLPDDSWVYEYNQSGSRYIISGKTTNASQLVQLLDKDPLFAEVSNTSTLSDQSDAEGIERFTLSFKAAANVECEEQCQ